MASDLEHNRSVSYNDDMETWVWTDTKIPASLYCHNCHSAPIESDGKKCAECGSTNLSID